MLKGGNYSVFFSNQLQKARVSTQINGMTIRCAMGGRKKNVLT